MMRKNNKYSSKGLIIAEPEMIVCEPRG